MSEEKESDAPFDGGSRDREKYDYKDQSVITERNRYFTGKYMTARDFAAEQDYYRNRHHIHNRLLHGWGVLCGLKVVHHPNPECRPNWVVVKSGIALDCLGRELFLHRDTALQIPLDRLPAADEVELEEIPKEWQASYIQSFDRWEDNGEAEREFDEDEGEGEEDYYWPRNGLLICLRYTEQLIEPVPALYAEGDCRPDRHEANRIREVAQLEIHRLDEMSPDCWRMPGGGWNSPCRDDCSDGVPGPTGVCLDPYCPCKGCVPLALLVCRRPDCDEGEPVFHIDLRGRRRLPTPSNYLTHIAAVNWPHGGRVSLHHLQDHMNGALRVRFNRRLMPAMGGRMGINSQTFTVQYGGIQRTLEYLPSAESSGPTLEENGRTAVYRIHPDYINRSHPNIAGTVVHVIIKCDFLLDCHEIPVDGNHLGGRLPSGNGTPGGVFYSWFKVVRKHSKNRED